MKTNKIMISGGGIAGLALGFWLERFGFEPVVVEHAHRFEALGHYIGLKGNGVNVIRQMGLEPACRAREATFGRAVMLTSHGSQLRCSGRSEMDQNLGGYIFFRRADLHAALFDAVRGKFEVHYATELASVQAAGDHLEVRLSSGASATVDLLVGADGIHSRTRRIVFGEGFEQPLGGHYIGMTVDTDTRLRGEDVYTYFGRGQVVMLTRTSERQVSAIVYHGDGGAPLTARDTRSVKRLLLDAYVDFPPEVGAVFNDINEQTFVFADTIAQVKMPSITKGRVALVGDAAHCPTFMSGMGSALALQGAQKLAQCLAENRDNPAQGLAAYEAAITPVASSYQASALQMRPNLLDRRRWVANARNVALRLTPQWLMDRRVRQFYHAEAAARGAA
jgi:2-polyprenyl-6-methoxyphenol hydroxylase-like FAD-dependent oxidoreductase